jgi:dTDP-4-amino-4,6-dideoxygalactose transaminase
LQARRRELALQYRELLGEIEGLQLVPKELHEGGADHLMVVLLPQGVDRTLVQKQLSAESIGSSVHFRPLHTFNWFADNGLSSGPGGTPVADTYVERALSLPFHTLLSSSDVERVCSVLSQALSN